MEPREGHRLDLVAAQIVAAVYNSKRTKKSTGQPIDPNDLLPDWWDRERFEGEPESIDELGEDMSPEDMAATLVGRFQTLNKPRD